ncbi:hypothetical protein TNCV_3040891 [Trichonephila clavipes]|nr:hypothetical protein TNCV_3040891 [Trichonephila clavipes]
MPKSNAQRRKVFRERKKKEKLAASPHSRKSDKKKQEKKPEKYCKFIKCYRGISIRVHEGISSTENKTLQNTLLMLSLRDGNTTENLLMTSQINTDLVNHPVPLTTENLNNTSTCWN